MNGSGLGFRSHGFSFWGFDHRRNPPASAPAGSSIAPSWHCHGDAGPGLRHELCGRITSLPYRGYRFPAPIWQLVALDRSRIVELTRCLRVYAVRRVVLSRRGERTGGESQIRTCMGLSLSSGVFRFIASSLFGAGKPFLIPSPTIRFPERAQWGQGTETLAKLSALPPSGACVWQRLDA